VKVTLRNLLTTLFSILLSVAVIVYVVSALDWQVVYDVLVHLNWGWLFLAWLVFLFNYVLRTLRFRVLIYTLDVPFRKLFSVACLHGMFNYLMPARSGEVSFPLLLKLRLSISLTESAVTLVTARFFDFATVALFLPAALIVFGHQLSPVFIYSAFAFCGLVAVSGGGMLWLVRKPATPLSLTDRGGAMSQEKVLSRLIKRVQKVWVSLIGGLRLIDQRRQYKQLLLLTIGIWLCVYTNYYLIVHSMGYEISYLHIAVVTIIMVPTKLLPVQGFANLGTHELGWVAGLALFGRSRDVSLAIAVGSHVILLWFVLILGGLGMLLGISIPSGASETLSLEELDD
jgi:uncharacterized protein (TIRG00374 family)